MPLRRPISTQADIIDDSDLLLGVRFAMFDGDARIICRVSYEALTDQAYPSDRHRLVWLQLLPEHATLRLALRSTDAS
jgi:hypothetical protein